MANFSEHKMRNRPTEPKKEVCTVFIVFKRKTILRCVLIPLPFFSLAPYRPNRRQVISVKILIGSRLCMIIIIHCACGKYRWWKLQCCSYVAELRSVCHAGSRQKLKCADCLRIIHCNENIFFGAFSNGLRARFSFSSQHSWGNPSRSD